VQRKTGQVEPQNRVHQFNSGRGLHYIPLKLKALIWPFLPALASGLAPVGRQKRRLAFFIFEED
jgi:hypothetical protein